jgi:hypothetical protein
MSLTLILIIHTILFSYLGPVFQLNTCGYTNMIFEKQVCVDNVMSYYIIPFGTMAYVCALFVYIAYEMVNSDFLLYFSVFMTLVTLSFYLYFLLSQIDVESFSFGYYSTIVSIVLLIFFVIVYKRKVSWLK